MHSFVPFFCYGGCCRCRCCCRCHFVLLVVIVGCFKMAAKTIHADLNPNRPDDAGYVEGMSAVFESLVCLFALMLYLLTWCSNSCCFTGVCLLYFFEASTERFHPRRHRETVWGNGATWYCLIYYVTWGGGLLLTGVCGLVLQCCRVGLLRWLQSID